MISVEDRELYESAHNGYNNKYHNDHYYACCARLFNFKLPNIDENLCIANLC